MSYKRNQYYPLPLLLIPFIQPKLALLPIAVIATDFLFFKEKVKYILFFLLVSLAVFAINFKPFSGQTIFVTSNNEFQSVIQKSQLYPTILLARTFQNKPRIILDKISSNFFSISDPNNYLFGFHPRENPVDNQNLIKYPFLSFIFFFIGIFVISKSKFKKEIIIFLVGSVVSLLVLKIFDRHDFILWVPLSIIFYEGITQTQQKYNKFSKVFVPIYILFSIVGLIQIIVDKSL